MRRPLTTWMLGGLLALAGTSWAQGVAPAGIVDGEDCDVAVAIQLHEVVARRAVGHARIVGTTAGV